MNARTRISYGLRTVALYEGTKGILVLLIGLGLSSLLNPHVRDIAEEMVRFFHVDKILHRPRFFFDFLQRANDQQLVILVLTALLYIAMCFAASFGLWCGYRWAEWLVAGSGALYLPFEIYELFRRVTSVRVLILLLNSLIVIYLLYLLAIKDNSTVPTQ
jgi:uncharacterized membrane protein (DUF2068 family)